MYDLCLDTYELAELIEEAAQQAAEDAYYDALAAEQEDES